MDDGTEENATLGFEGYSGQVAAAPVAVRILARVESTPDFDFSSITMPSTVNAGTTLVILIMAVDVDGLLIQNGNGRFFVVCVEGSAKKKTYRSTSAQNDGRVRRKCPAPS
jgi:hypothetical protein